MKLLLLLLLALVCAVEVSVEATNQEPAESQQIIDIVNNANTTWKAARNFHPKFTKGQMHKLLGYNKAAEQPLPEKEGSGMTSQDIPDYFDSRVQWPNCASISDIKDQSVCGSCWAVSGAATFSDRLCIVSNGTFNDELSAAELLSCCWYCAPMGGCNGGTLGMTWLYFRLHGIVSGGAYGSYDGCQPYPLEPCEHHTNGTRPQCESLGYKTPKCAKKCTNPDYSIDFKTDHHKVHKSYSVKRSVEAIQEEIMTNGPVQAAFTVYSDFVSYSSGVYQHVTGSEEGGHAVKIIGWGVENNTPYWLVANSWNTDWGNDGFFKILRGNNECGIEESIYAGIPTWAS